MGERAFRRDGISSNAHPAHRFASSAVFVRSSIRCRQSYPQITQIDADLGKTNSSSSKRRRRWLGASHVGAGASVDLNIFTFFDEERNVACLPCREQSLLCHIACGVAAHAFRRFNDLETDGGGQFNLYRSPLGVENLQREIFNKII